MLYGNIIKYAEILNIHNVYTVDLHNTIYVAYLFGGSFFFYTPDPHAHTNAGIKIHKLRRLWFMKIIKESPNGKK